MSSGGSRITWGVGLVLVASFAVGACSRSTEISSETTTATTVAPSTTTTTTPPTTTTTTTTTSTTTTTTTTTSSTTTTTTTTLPVSVTSLDLRADGIGTANLGAEPDGVINYVRSLLGSPTADTDWVDPFTFASCDGTEARRVDWGVLSLLFADSSSISKGRRHFIGWEYGNLEGIGDEPVGLRAEGAISLGSSVLDLRAAFPDVAINEGEEGSFFNPPNFYVSDNFRGLVTGTTDTDAVTVMFGGPGCAS